MDGYAVRSTEVQAGQALPVSQKIFAGHSPEPLAEGTCARIFTGAPMPEGADAVEMQETPKNLTTVLCVLCKQCLRLSLSALKVKKPCPVM